MRLLISTLMMTGLLLATSYAQPVHADFLSTIQDVGQSALEKSQEVGGQAWEKTRELSGQALEKTRDAVNRTDTPAAPSTVPATTSEAHFQQVWGDVLNKLDKALKVADDMEAAPSFAIFGDDKDSLRKDFNKILDKIVILLDGGAVLEARQMYESRKANIVEARGRIMALKEKRITAPVEATWKDTRQEIDNKIAGEEQKIRDLEAHLRAIESQLQRALATTGVHLSRDQVTVLLSRVDGNDLLQMAGVFDVVRQVTEKLMQLSAETGEDMRHAKRYYGMHMVLLEMVYHMQSGYVAKIDTDYIPRIERLVERTGEVNQQSRASLKQESDTNRRNIYKKNIVAQKLTLKVARLYMEGLRSQRKKVLKARETILQDLQLARNTYATVEVSANLLQLLKDGQQVFEVISNLQVPDLVPFENAEMQRKFNEISQMLGQ